MDIKLESTEFLRLQIAEHKRMLKGCQDDPILAPQHISIIQVYQQEIDSRIITPEIEKEILAFGKLEKLTSLELTGVVMTYLSRKGIDAEPYAGSVRYGGLESTFRFWLDLEDGRRIDMRLDADLKILPNALSQNFYQILLPYGIFDPAKHKDVDYSGFPFRYALLSDAIFDFLTNKE